MKVGGKIETPIDVFWGLRADFGKIAMEKEMLALDGQVKKERPLVMVLLESVLQNLAAKSK